MNHYERFRELHHGASAFVLANVWNVKSAQIAEATGFAAIGTSSGAIADSLGYADGEKIPFEEVLYLIRRIRALTNIPLTVDMERGYNDDTSKLNTYIQQLLDVGVAGINIEDAQGEEIYLRKLHSISDYLQQTKQRLFINARTDVYLQQPEAPLETVLRRAQQYKEAGAEGLFVTGVQDIETIKRITAGTSLPVNVVATPKVGDVHDLAASGVKRISMAVFMYRATYQHMERVATQVVSQQSFAELHKTATA